MRRKFTSSVFNNVAIESTLRHPKYIKWAAGSKFDNLKKSGIKIRVISPKVTSEATGIVEMVHGKSKQGEERASPEEPQRLTAG